MTEERKPFRSRRGLALWLGLVVTIGLLFFVYRHLEAVVSGDSVNPLAPFINEMTGALAAGLLFFPLRELVRRLPLTRAHWARRLPVYLLALLAYGAASTSMMWGFRSLLYPLAGLGRYDYGAMPLRYVMELPIQAIGFTLLVIGLHVYAALKAAREREIRAAQLEGSLARAQLRNLRLQLQPHFLFNALNTISATMYDDPAAADEMLEQLSELLRASLRTAQSDEVSLAEELSLLDRYLAIMRARFGERLTIALDLDPEASAALVPSLLLQPLVENAIRHGNAERAGRGTVAVRSRKEGNRLILEVEDDGPGDQEAAPDRPPGLGLAATAERLRLLYGDGQSFSAGNGPGGGFLVRATLPFRTAEAA